jgi:archaeal cell division control protein 6
MFMSLFNNVLKSDQTLFKDAVALDYDYLPKLLPFREKEQFQVANCIKPLFSNRNGRNIIVFGTPGIGKTAACKHILRDLEEQNDEIHQIFINCWQKNSSYKVFIESCSQVGYKFTHNKRTDELFNELKRILNKSSAVIVFDEIDKSEDYDFLYALLEEIYKKTIILITNEKDWIYSLDERIKSRLTPELIEFKSYSLDETKNILKERIKFALFENVMPDELLDPIVEKTFESKDIRTGLFLIKEAANCAEDASRKTITLDDVNKAIFKLLEFKKKDSQDLSEDEFEILDLIKHNSGKKIGDLFKEYQLKNPNIIYKTFQRKIKKLSDNNFISSKTITGGKEGTTTILEYDSSKKLTDF